MADPNPPGGEKLYTLTEVSKKTNISMPTLQRYKKLYQSRLPSVGRGRKQRYTEAALAVFDQLKVENVARRGRPRKDQSAPKPSVAAAKAVESKKKGAAKPAKAAKAAAKKVAAKPARPAKPAKAAKATKAAKPAPKAAASGKAGRKPAAAAPAKAGGLLTLTEVSKRTGISHPTLSRYVKQHGDRLRSEGAGRARRFYEEALKVFSELRSQSTRGRKAKGGAKAAAAKTVAPKAASPNTAAPRTAAPKAAPKAAKKGRGKKAAAGRVAVAAAPDHGDLLKRLASLEKLVQSLEKRLNKPMRVTVQSR